jgi:hypothetical protein
MLRGEALRDRQADAGAAGVVAVAGLVEAVEDPVLLVRWDAGAFVGDRDDDFSLGAPRAHHDEAARR